MTETKNVPKWLDLDAVVPPELREEIDAIHADTLAMLPELQELADRFKLVAHRFAEATKGDDLEDGAYVTVADVSGFRRLDDLADFVAEMFTDNTSIRVDSAGFEHAMRTLYGLPPAP